jgi:hypothetical protein
VRQSVAAKRIPDVSYSFCRQPPIRAAAARPETPHRRITPLESTTMNRPSTTTSSTEPLVARWALAGVAFAVAAFLLMFYVQLLHESVARGAQWRYSQSSATTNPVAEAATNASVRLVSTSP